MGDLPAPTELSGTEHVSGLWRKRPAFPPSLRFLKTNQVTDSRVCALSERPVKQEVLCWAEHTGHTGIPPEGKMPSIPLLTFLWSLNPSTGKLLLTGLHATIFRRSKQISKKQELPRTYSVKRSTRRWPGLTRPAPAVRQEGRLPVTVTPGT